MSRLFQSLRSKATNRLHRLRIGSSYWALYRLLDDAESRCVLFTGIVCATAAGVPLPLIAVVFRSVIEEFPPTEDQVQVAIHYILGISSAYFAFTWTWTICWGVVGGRISRRIQELLVEKIVSLDMEYFDTEPLDLTTILTADTQTIQRGTSEKVGLFIQSISYFIATFITGFILSPALTGVLLAAILPSMLILVTVGSSLVSKYSREASKLSETAAAAAEQAIRSVQVVQAFGAIDVLCDDHAKVLRQASHFAFRKSISAALMLGLVYFVCYSVNALAFYWGTQLGGSAGTIYAVVFLILDASFVVNQVGPFIQTIAMASAAGGKVLDLINHKTPKIDASAKDGKALDKLEDITCHDVSFVYPSRPGTKVLDSVNLCLKAGSSTGIVGASGSGKSSLVGLLMRLYDPSSGSITIGGTPLSEFNVKSLRSKIALVDQEPVLFAGTILDNIRAGIVDADDLDADKVRERCKQAAADANADFVQQLERGIDSEVSGTSLSGGQRQRICLARALVRKPACLVLDEPTSALDSTSEVKILESLKRCASSGCTIIMIAHRLSTVKDLGQIVVIGDGSVLEQGSHDDLMAKEGVYKALVDAQQMGDTPPASSSASTTTLYGPPGGHSRGRWHSRRHRRRLSSTTEADGSGDESSSEDLDMAADSDDERIPSQKPTRIPAVGQAPGSVPGDILDAADLRRQRSHRSTGEAISKAASCPRDEPASQDQANSWRIILRTIKLSKPESPLLVVGMIASCIMGAIIVYEAIVFGNLIAIINGERSSDFQERVNFFCLNFFIISLIALVMSGTSNSCFGLVSETLLTRIRDSSLRNILSQDQSFFQIPEHSAHRLLAAINADSNFVAGLTGNILATIFSVCFNIISGLAVALAFAWEIALVLMAIIPAIVLAGYLRVKMLTRFEKNHSESFKHAAALASEAVQNIRTVAAFGQEKEVLRQYCTAIEKPYRSSFWFSVFGDLALTLNYCIVYFTYALAYWWGSRLVRNGQFTEQDFFTMLPAFLLTAQQSGQLFTAAPEIVQARSAAHRLFALLDEKPTIIEHPNLGGSRTFLAREKDDIPSKEEAPSSSSSSETGNEKHEARAAPSSDPASPSDPGRQLQRGASVELDRVSLSYPSRPGKQALSNVSLIIKSGQSVGIVGPSGAGKSSLISLLERFFDPIAGSVLIDGEDIRARPVGKHRARLSLVSQEPSLFSGSVAFNISLGASPDAPRPSQETIETTCRRIGMHDFIMSLPEGYSTDCGSGGSRLSGGQKQRVAIARALIRDPEILILDEATSALDSHSEKQVQDAIAAASEGRTTITVAHRLSTIQHADVVFCFDGGKLVEQGKHDELVEIGGIYAGMVKAQALH